MYDLPLVESIQGNHKAARTSFPYRKPAEEVHSSICIFTLDTHVSDMSYATSAPGQGSTASTAPVCRDCSLLVALNSRLAAEVIYHFFPCR
jgi:hypothetical protein